MTELFIYLTIFSLSAANPQETLFRQYWEFTVSSQPEYATSVGDRRFNDRLNNYTIAFIENTKLTLRNFQNQAKALLVTVKNNATEEANLKFLITELHYKINLINTKNYFFSVNHLDGPPTSLLQLLYYQPMIFKSDFDNLLKRYKAFPQQVREIISMMKEGIRVKMVLHERSLKNYEKQIRDLTSVPPTESVFYEPFKKISSWLYPDEKKKCSKLAEKYISEDINTGLNTLSNFIQKEYRPNTRKNIASSSLPDGYIYYFRMLDYYVTAFMVDPRTIYNMGQAEVKRISKEMEQVIRTIGYNVTIQQFNSMLRRNTSPTFHSKEEAIDSYIVLIRGIIEPILPKYFKKIPKAKLVIKEVPKELTGRTVAYYKPAGGLVRGTFYLDLSDPQKAPIIQMVTLSLHEAEPGHHFQISYNLENRNVPIFRKLSQYPLYAAFIEGWGLYSEYLGKEMKLFEDKFMLYGHLSDEIFRACQLVVDTGIHSFGWTRKQAIDFMMQHTPASKTMIENEVDRCITWPGQACSYKYGQIKLKEFRSRAETALGNKFNIKDFHEVILSSTGTLDFIKQQVDQYIKSKI